MQQPPFRADHVGSFLRPKFLLDAREQFRNQEISSEQLREVEDRAIRDIVKFQEDLGLEGITDGEYRRTYFHTDFLTQLGGVVTEGGINVSFKTADGSINFAPPVMKVEGKVSHLRSIQGADFDFLKSITNQDSEGDHSITDHAAFSGRPQSNQRRGLSGNGGLLLGCCEGLSGGVAFPR